MTTHHNWFFREDPAREDASDSGAATAPAAGAGPLVIFDLDGVISNASHRQHFMRESPKNFRGFFLAAVDDPPLDVGRALAASVADDHAVAILTARPFYVAENTRSWLAANDVRHDLLILRPRWGTTSRGTAADFKRRELHRLWEAGYEVTVALDDDERVINMYRSEGVFALYIHSGYYER